MGDSYVTLPCVDRRQGGAALHLSPPPRLVPIRTSALGQGRLRHQVGGTAGVPSAPEMLCTPRQFRLVPLPDVVNVGITDHARTTQAGPAPTFTATRERGMDE